jgi:hypothetical protein
MRRLNALALAGHYVDHIAPVWHALPKSARGIFWVRSDEAKRAAARNRIASRQWNPNTANNQIIITSALGDLNVAWRAGARTILMEHGAGQTYNTTHSSYAGGSHPSRDACELFLVPGTFPAQKLRQKHPNIPVVEIGSPKLDRLAKFKRPNNEIPKVVISWHWDCKVVPETRWAFPYYRRAVTDLLRHKDIEVYGHAHPRALKHIEPWCERYGIPFIERFSDVIKQADCYAIDNSSSLFEAAACGIPVVVVNSPHYRKSVNHGLRFWDAANIGPQVNRGSEFYSAIKQSLDPSDWQKQETERCLDLTYSVRDGSSVLAANTIIDLVLR